MATDLSPYRQYVDQFNISEEQKLELVNARWIIADQLLDKKFRLGKYSKND